MPGERTLVLGGARSGKSHFAESLLTGHDRVRYVATGYTHDTDPEWTQRVRAHQQRRPAGWTTLETIDLPPLLASDGPPLLVDCMSVWLARIIDTSDGWQTPVLPADVERRVDEVIDAWRGASGPVVAVSNEVGMGVVPATPSGRRFRDELGTLNRRLAAVCDVVWVVVAGLPMRVK